VLVPFSLLTSFFFFYVLLNTKVHIFLVHFCSYPLQCTNWSSMNELSHVLTSQGQGPLVFFANQIVPSRVYPIPLNHFNENRDDIQYVAYPFSYLLSLFMQNIVVIHLFIRIYQILITCLIDVCIEFLVEHLLIHHRLFFFLSFIAFNLRKNER
jgi:hypothetical protein